MLRQTCCLDERGVDRQIDRDGSGTSGSVDTTGFRPFVSHRAADFHLPVDAMTEMVRSRVR